MQTELENQPKYFDQLEEKKPRNILLIIKIFLAVVVFLFGLAVIVALLVLKKPADYNPPEAPPDKYVSQYLTNYISTEIYNGAQTGEPFDLVITEYGINDVIARSGWPKAMDNVSFSCPETTFEQDLIHLKGLMLFGNLKLYITVSAAGFLEDDGLMQLSVKQVKIGALNLLPIARLAAISIYQKEAAQRKLAADSWESKIMEALLFDKPFVPIFKVEDNYIRITKVDIEQGYVLIHFDPVKPQEII